MRTLRPEDGSIGGPEPGMTFFVFRPEPTIRELQAVIAQLAKHRYIVRSPSGLAYIDTNVPQPGDTIVWEREDGKQV
jgi:cystathionine beta-lyase/cystathionine gamma-synthase